MKKILIVSFFLAFVGPVPYALAQSTTNCTPGSFCALAPIPGLTSPETTSVINSATLAVFFNNLYKYSIGLAAVLAVIMIIWGGLEISTQDSISKQGAGRDKIYNAIFGLILVLSPVVVFSIINPSILNLSLNLPELKTAPVTPTGSINTTTVTQQGGGNVGGDIAAAQAACRAKGGTPVLDSSNLAVGGTAKVTCTMTPAVQAGQQMTQQQCLNLSPQGIILTGFSCSTAPASALSMQQAGGYTCNDLSGGGVCFHK